MKCESLLGRGLHLLGDAEVDREMREHFRQRSEERTKEKADFASPTSVMQNDSYISTVVDSDDEIDDELRQLLANLSSGVGTVPSDAIVMDASGPDLLKPTLAPSWTADDVVAPVPRSEPHKVPTGAAKPEIKVGVTATDLALFPVSSLDMVTECDNPLHAMKELCQRLLTHKNYELVREDYCQLFIRLNLNGKLAPGWRPLLKAGAGWGNAIHKVIHRDQVVIDLHWCHATKMPLMPQDADHVALFSDSEGFDFELAWELAGKKWKGTYRAVEALCLTTLQQCQTLTLVGPELKARLDDIDSGWRKSEGKTASKMATIKCQISQWAERDKRISPRRADYEKLWLARELLGRDTSKQLIAELHALIVGDAVRDRTTIRDMLKSLDKHITVT